LDRRPPAVCVVHTPKQDAIPAQDGSVQLGARPTPRHARRERAHRSGTRCHEAPASTRNLALNFPPGPGRMPRQHRPSSTSTGALMAAAVQLCAHTKVRHQHAVLYHHPKPSCIPARWAQRGSASVAAAPRSFATQRRACADKQYEKRVMYIEHRRCALPSKLELCKTQQPAMQRLHTPFRALVWIDAAGTRFTPRHCARGQGTRCGDPHVATQARQHCRAGRRFPPPVFSP